MMRDAHGIYAVAPQGDEQHEFNEDGFGVLAAGCCEPRRRPDEGLDAHALSPECVKPAEDGPLRAHRHADPLGRLQTEAEWLVKLTAGSPGGIGNTGAECGGVTAPLILIGLRHARDAVYDGLPPVIDKGHDLLQRFAGRHGTTLCCEIRGTDRLPLRCVGAVCQAPELCAQTRSSDCAHVIPAASEVVERHQVHVVAPAAITLAAAREMDLLHSPLVRAIIKGREMILGATPDDRPRPRGLLAEVQSLGWGVLADVPGREIVVGGVTKRCDANPVFRALPPDEFVAFSEPDYVKIVWTLRADPLGAAASIFRTETRVMCTDRAARAKSPGTGLSCRPASS